MIRIRFIVMIASTVLFCTFSSSIYSQQKAIQLTKVDTGKKQILNIGHRVEYTLRETPRSHYVGILESISADAVIIQSNTIAIDQLKSIGRRRKGSGFWAFTCGFIGTGLIVGAIQSSNDDPCPSCTNAGSSGEEWTAVEIGLGVAILGLGINVAVRNSPRDLVAKWNLAIIEIDDSQKIK